MTTGQLVAAGLGAVVLLGVGAAVVGLGSTEEVSFTLSKDTGGKCQASMPDPIRAYWLHKVTWTVTNANCDGQYVSLRNFQRRTDAGLDSEEVILKPQPVDGGPIATGATVAIDAKVKNPHLGARFKYEIWIGLTAGSVAKSLDPDIEIWP